MGGGGGMELGEEGEYIPIAYTVTTRVTCIKMGSDESHFNVSLIVRDKVTRPCPQTTTFLKRNESRSGIEPRINGGSFIPWKIRHQWPRIWNKRICNRIGKEALPCPCMTGRLVVYSSAN